MKRWWDSTDSVWFLLGINGFGAVATFGDHWVWFALHVAAVTLLALTLPLHRIAQSPVLHVHVDGAMSADDVAEALKRLFDEGPTGRGAL